MQELPNLQPVRDRTRQHRYAVNQLTAAAALGVLLPVLLHTALQVLTFIAVGGPLGAVLLLHLTGQRF